MNKLKAAGLTSAMNKGDTPTPEPKTAEAKKDD